MKIHESVAPTSTIQGELGAIEAELIRLTQEAGVGESPLDGIIAELMGLGGRIRRELAELQEALERRDLTYDDAAQLQEVRRRALWLYRRSRLERVFYGKLRLERMLRDSLHRQVLEVYDELLAMEAEERRLNGLSDESLMLDLLREAQGVCGREGTD